MKEDKLSFGARPGPGEQDASWWSHERSRAALQGWMAGSVAPPAPQGSSGGGVGSRGGGRMCQSLDTLEGCVTSPPLEKLLEVGATVERGDVYSEAKQGLSPLLQLLDH